MTSSVSRCKSLLTSDLRLHVIVGLGAYRLQFILCKYMHILHDYTLYISTCTWLYKWFICNFPAALKRWFLSCATKIAILEGDKKQHTLLRQLRPQTTLSFAARTIPACSYLITHTLLPVVEHSSRPCIQANCSELCIQQHRAGTLIAVRTAVTCCQVFVRRSAAYIWRWSGHCVECLLPNTESAYGLGPQGMRRCEHQRHSTIPRPSIVPL